MSSIFRCSTDVVATFWMKTKLCSIPRSLQRADNAHAPMDSRPSWFSPLWALCPFLAAWWRGAWRRHQVSRCQGSQLWVSQQERLGGGAWAVSPGFQAAPRSVLGSVLPDAPLSPASFMNLGMAGTSSKANLAWYHLIKALWKFLRTPEFPEEPWWQPVTLPVTPVLLSLL